MKIKNFRYSSRKIIFNLLSPFYDKLIVLTVAHPNRYEVKIQLSQVIKLKELKVLDLGCGTGLWSKVLYELGAEVVGVDFSNRLLLYAKRKYGRFINFHVMDIKTLEEIKDKSFDIVTAAYVFHGLNREDRKNILCQVKRITRGHVVIYDFAARIPLIPELIEIVEGSDYKCFIRYFYNEIKDNFNNVRKIELLYGAGLYIASGK